MLTKMLDFYLHECSCKQSCQITAAWSCNVTFKRPNQSTTLTHLGAYIYICILSIASVNPGSSDSMPQENFVPILPAMVDTQYWAPWKLRKDPIIQLILAAPRLSSTDCIYCHADQLTNSFPQYAHKVFC
jgi:hypothetical protein